MYYTPRYIVNFIVENTIGKLLAGKSPQAISKLRFVDPACGSGSFLLRVFERVCEHHLKWFEQHPHHQKRGLCYRDNDGDLRLTTHLKRQIMLNNIFGVDLDYQAVEVTMLSLYLKILEDETRTTLGRQRLLFPTETFLPDLSGNIKCGNSLVAHNFYEQLSLLEPQRESRVNAFDWEREFPVAKGGFDAVVGNPPYVRIQILKESRPDEAVYFKQHFATAKRGNYDLYSVFAEKGFSLLNRTGVLGYILPSKFLATDYGEPLRQMLSNKKAVTQIVDFKHEQVFEGPTTYTCLLFLSKTPQKYMMYSVASPPEMLNLPHLVQRTIPASELGAAPWAFGSKMAADIRRKLNEGATPLLELPSVMSRGSSSGADDVFMLTKAARGYETRDGQPVEIEEEILRVPIYATDFSRYEFRPKNNERIIFPYEVADDGYSLIKESVFQSQFPKAHAYLKSRKRELRERKQYAAWYSYSAPRGLDAHEKADFIVPLLANRGLFAPMPKNKSRYCMMAGGGFSIRVDESSGCSPEYLLGIVNSKLMFWMLQAMSNVFRGGWITCTKQYVGRLPIRRVRSSDLQERSLYNAIITAVPQLASTNRSPTIPASSRASLQRPFSKQILVR